MTKAMDALHHNLATIRTGRASPALLDRIHVDYYGTSTPLNQLAGISAPEPRMLVIQPWDRGSMGPIEKAIMQSDLGLTPNNDGQLIRINIPTLTEERRKQLVKVVTDVRRARSPCATSGASDDPPSQRSTTRRSPKTTRDARSDEMDTLARKYVRGRQIGKVKEHEVLESRDDRHAPARRRNRADHHP